jgi:DNA (cytosine-5)-methyltransferase 1
MIVGDRYLGVLGPPSPYSASLRTDSGPAGRPRAAGLGGCRLTAHTPAVQQRFAATLAGAREPISHFERLAASGTAGTLRAGTALAEGKFTAPRPIHPSAARCITVREAARLHSFPDWFEFNPTVWHGFRQIGNSVPPLLAEALARSVFQSIARSSELARGMTA